MKMMTAPRLPNTAIDAPRGSSPAWEQPGARARGSRGFALISAVVLIVVFALLGAAIVSLSTTHQISSARDLFGSRAYFAAKAGIEWGAYQVLQSGSCAASSTLPSLSGSAAGFTVAVTCTRSGPIDEAGSSVFVYQITSTASIGTLGAAGYAERQLQAVLSTP